MKNHILCCQKIKEIDMVDYLERLGHQPNKIRNNDYWYVSPLREEKEPSFKVNRKINAWYDHGMGRGGNIIDFGILYHRCGIKELLIKMSRENTLAFSFHPPQAVEKKENPGYEKVKILITDSRRIRSAELLKYLDDRKIPLEIANSFCSETDFELYGRTHRAIGFRNDSGGYELRNAYFKGSSSPKDSTLIKNCDEKLSVFEGFFNFLSFHVQHHSDKNSLRALSKEQDSFLILNSLSFIEKNLPVMGKYQSVHLYLDRDNSGIKHTLKLLCLSQKCIDKSAQYKHCKDLNEWLIKSCEKINNDYCKHDPIF